MKKIFAAICCVLVGLPCLAFPKLEGNVKKNSPVTPVHEQQMTLGIVQRQIKIGTSQDEVAIALGSPNIVTKDSDGKDTWIYDKVSSITSYSDSGFGVGAAGGGLGYGDGSGGGGILGIGYKRANAQVQSVQKTLTVVIKFDNNNKVESFTYHMSTF